MTTVPGSINLVLMRQVGLRGLLGWFLFFSSNLLQAQEVDTWDGPGVKPCVLNPDLSLLQSRWGMWDAEGTALSTEDVLAMRDQFSGSVYFYNKSKPQVNLRTIRESGVLVFKVIQPFYVPDPTWRTTSYDNPKPYLRWAVAEGDEGLNSPFVDGIAYDPEMRLKPADQVALVHHYKIQAYKKKKFFMIAPHWNPDVNQQRYGLSQNDMTINSDFLSPWMYSRNGHSSYRMGLGSMVRDWLKGTRNHPIFPIFDHGRKSYGTEGITPDEAALVPEHLSGLQVGFITLFIPYVAYYCAKHLEDAHPGLAKRYPECTENREGLQDLLLNLKRYYPAKNIQRCHF